MKMTKEQEDKLAKAGRLVKEAFPKVHGSVKFNLQPGRTKVDIKIEQNIILADDNKTHKEQ